MFARKFDYTVFNGGIFKYHPFFIGAEALEAKPNERVRIYFVNAGPNEFSSLHPIGEIWDNVYESGILTTNSRGSVNLCRGTRKRRHIRLGLRYHRGLSDCATICSLEPFVEPLPR